MRMLRTLRHLLADAIQVRRLYPGDAMQVIAEAIRASEARHDGELRFCVEAGLPWSYLRRDASARERALMLFSKLRVWDTERNTGVLLYVLVADRGIEIVADRGIARRVPPAVWDAICGDLGRDIAAGRAVAGTVAAIGRIGAVLAEHAPPAKVNDNELPDAPVIL